jgi:hypothetical protein
MRASLMEKTIWGVVSGSLSAPADPGELKKWKEMREKAVGMLFLALEEDQRVHLGGEWDDPAKMWTSLQAVHLQKRPAVRFNAYQGLFNIRKEDTETLSSLIGRVEASIQQVKDARPKDYSLTDLDGDLASMSLIRALPDSYQSFISSLIMLPSC